MAHRAALRGADALPHGVLPLQRRRARPPDVGRGVAAAGRSAEIRHRLGRLRRRGVHPAVAAAPAPARTALVPGRAVLVLRRGQRRAGRGDEPRRHGLFPLHAEAFHSRRNLLRRQRQLVAAGREIHGRELVSGASVDRPDRPAGVGLPPQGAGREHFQPRMGLLHRQHGDLRGGRGAERRRDARRHDPHDAPDHPVERHALHRRQRQGQPHPEQSVLHPAHHRQRGERQIQETLRPGGAGAALHARAPACGQRGREPRGPQRRGLHHGEHVGRTLGLPLSGGLRRPGGERVPRPSSTR